MCDGVCFGAADVGIGRLRAHMSIAGLPRWLDMGAWPCSRCLLALFTNCRKKKTRSCTGEKTDITTRRLREVMGRWWRWVASVHTAKA
jgi:hypothetical protein